MSEIKVKELTNVSFSYNDLLNYYTSLETNYQHLKWTTKFLSNDQRTLFKESQFVKHMEDIFTWAIQNRSKTTEPTPGYVFTGNEYSPVSEPSDELIFGFAKLLVDHFDGIFRLMVGSHPPNGQLCLHNDDYYTVHFPIKSNDKSYFVVDGETFVLKPGKAYLVNTLLPHYTDNQGTTNRVHLLFNIPLDSVDTVLNSQIILQ